MAVGFTPLNIPPAFVYDCSQRPADMAPVVRVRPAVGSFYAAALAGVAMIVRAFQNF